MSRLLATLAAALLAVPAWPLVKSHLKPYQLKRIETYMRKTFGARSLEVRGRQKAADAAEVYLAGEFIGVISKDTEDGEIRLDGKGV